MSDNEVNVRVTANTGELASGMGKAATATEQTSQRMRDAMQQVRDKFQSIGPIVAGAITAVAGAMALAVKSSVNFQDEMSKGAQRAGVTTEAFSELAYVAKLADVEVGEMARTFAKLATTLEAAKAGQKDAVELLSRLKIDPSKLKDGDELLMALADRFAAMADGATKTAMAVEVFGERIGPKLIPFLNAGRAGIEGLREEARQLGVTVSTETGKAAEEFNDTLTTLQQRVAGLKLGLASQLLPTLQSVANGLRDVDRDGKAVAAVGGAMRTVFQALAVLGANVSFVLQGIGREVGAIAAQAVALATGNLSGFNAISEAVKADGKRAREELDLFERSVLGLGGPGTRQAEDRGFTPESGKSAGFVPRPKPGPAADKAPSIMPTLEAGLDAERAAAAERDALRGLSKRAEMEYWQGILAVQTLSAQDSLAVGRKVLQARTQLVQQEAREAKQVSATNLDAWRESKLSEIDIEADAARTRVALGQSTTSELLAEEAAFEERRFVIRMAALRSVMATVDPARDPVQLAETLAKIQALEQAHQQRMAEIRGQSAVQSAAEVGAAWSEVSARVSSLWDQGFQAMMNSTLTWKGALNAVGAEVAGYFSTATKRMVMEWAFGEKAKTGATTLGAVQRVAVESWAAVKSVTLWAWAAVKNIMANAWAAMAAAWQAMVGIPYVGPFLAVAAAGAAFAGVSALAGKVHSARGGFDIPAGVNPMTQLHEREMVLPATQADVIRDMASNGGSSGGEPIHIHGTPDDSIKLKDLGRVLKRMNRHFEFSG